MPKISYTIVTEMDEITVPEFDEENEMHITINNDIVIYLKKDEVISLIENLQKQVDKNK